MTFLGRGAAHLALRESTMKRVVLCFSSSMFFLRMLNLYVLAASCEAMAAHVGSPRSATSRADPAVSAATTGFKFSLRMILRHCPSAITWLSTDVMVRNVAPL